MPQLYYVATRVMFVVVEAASEDDARRLGATRLRELYGQRLRRNSHVVIETVRLATDEETHRYKTR